MKYFRTSILYTGGRKEVIMKNWSDLRIKHLYNNIILTEVPAR